MAESLGLRGLGGECNNEQNQVSQGVGCTNIATDEPFPMSEYWQNESPLLRAMAPASLTGASHPETANDIEIGKNIFKIGSLIGPLTSPPGGAPPRARSKKHLLAKKKKRFGAWAFFIFF